MKHRATCRHLKETFLRTAPKVLPQRTNLGVVLQHSLPPFQDLLRLDPTSTSESFVKREIKGMCSIAFRSPSSWKRCNLSSTMTSQPWRPTLSSSSALLELDESMTTSMFFHGFTPMPLAASSICFDKERFLGLELLIVSLVNSHERPSSHRTKMNIHEYS